MNHPAAPAAKHGRQVDPDGGDPSGGPGRKAAPALDPEEAARYIAQLTGELAGIARSSRLDLLAYFLDMARMEAQVKARGLSKERREG